MWRPSWKVKSGKIEAIHLAGSGIFTALSAAARANPAARLLEWWPERRCQDMWGAFTRPDGYGKWRENGAEYDFFVEYDTGTETLRKVSRKLDGYAELAAASEVTTPVLIWTASRSREASLHRLLAAAPVPVATTTRHAVRGAGGWGPAGPAWMPAEPSGASRHSRRRLRLIEVAGPQPATSPLARNGPDRADGDDADEQ